MRATPSSSASGKFSLNGSLHASLTISPLISSFALRSPEGGETQFAIPNSRSIHGSIPPPRARGISERQGLSHDARNLLGAVQIYCELLAMPGVVGPEYRHYADELHLIADRSRALIDRIGLSAAERREADAVRTIGSGRQADAEQRRRTAVLPGGSGEAQKAEPPADAPVALRTIVDRMTGILTRLAGGRAVEVSYGAAAGAPISVPEEAVERILVNLVRNAAAAMREKEMAWVRADDAAPAPATGAICIGVGRVVNRAEDQEPWLCRRVRLTVEDRGCGMAAEQLARALRSSREPGRGSHGVGLRVVEDLTASSGGDLRIISEVGRGTCVQIEWPVALMVGLPEDGALPDDREPGSRHVLPDAALEDRLAVRSPAGRSAEGTC